MITLIIPCLNEEKNITNIKKNILLFKNNEHLIVDGGSCDASIKLFKKYKFNFIQTSSSRGLQQKKGAENATSKWLFFLHADTLLNKNNIQDIKNFLKNLECKNKVGYFKLSFNERSFSSKLISIWANLRTIIFKLPFGDQGLLIKRNYYLELGGHSNKVIMEDLEFIIKVPKNNRILLNSYVSTSFKRYKKNGLILQGIVHLFCQIMFFLNVSNKLIYKVYKKYEK